MKRVAAGAHLPNPWVFEPTTRPDEGKNDSWLANTMKRVVAGAHLPTPWLFEPTTRPDEEKKRKVGDKRHEALSRGRSTPDSLDF